MQPLLSTFHDWRRPFWLSLLMTASIAFTFAFACGVPFAAFAAATALTLPKRDAAILILGVWLVNQLIGFSFLHYPWDASTFAWGAALGVTALIAMLAARIVATRLRHLPPLLCCTLAFLAAFAAYEASCYSAALLLGGEEDFTLLVQARIFAINACAFVGLFVVNQVGSALRLAPASPSPVPARSHA